MNRQRGLTLLELLVVLGLITVIAGVSVGLMKRRDRTLTLEANSKLVRSVLRLARNSARTSGSGAVVRFDVETSSIEASPVETGAHCHFEDDFVSRGITAKHSGQIVEEGKFGRCLRLAGGECDFGSHPFYHPENGFRATCWVQPDAGANGVIFELEGSFKLELGQDGSLTAELRSGKQGVVTGLETRAGLVEAGRWQSVSLTYDRLEFAIDVDGVRYAARKQLDPVTIDLKGHLNVGSARGGIKGLVDEFRYDVVAAAEREQLSAGADLKEGTDTVIRFDPKGRLDPRHHRRPAIILIEGDAGENEDAQVESIRIEMSGVIR